LGGASRVGGRTPRLSIELALTLTAQYIYERIGGLELDRLLPARAEFSLDPQTNDVGWAACE
jgi:hypothetical protein